MSLHREDIEQAFCPSTKVRDTRLFAGRGRQVETGIAALYKPGSLIAIYGLRGAGKSSLGLQLGKIAKGDSTLAINLGLEKELPRTGFNYETLYFCAHDGIANAQNLLSSLIVGDGADDSLLSAAGELRSTESKTSLSASIGGGAIPASLTISRESASAKYSLPSMEATFTEFKKLIAKFRIKYKQKKKLLIIIDEFDRIRNQNGLASVIRELSSETLKFALIGIADSIGDLVIDHLSLTRNIHSISLQTMTISEMRQILENSERVLKGKLRFSAQAKSAICDNAKGYPHFVHLLGLESALQAWRDAEKKNLTTFSVEEKHAVFAKNLLFSGALSLAYNSVYCEIVSEFPEREFLLKMISQQNIKWLDRESLLRETRNLVRGSNPQHVISSFIDDMNKYKIIREKDGKLVFNDPGFMVYVRMRSPIYKGPD